MTDRMLYRLAALAGLVSAGILVLNVFRRAGLVPTDAVTHAIAPWAGALALFAVVGLYLWRRAEAGVLGILGYGLSTAGFTGAVGVELAVQYIFPNMPQAQVDALVAGPARPALVTVAGAFSLGAVLFGAALIRAGGVPRVAAAGYLVTMALFAWRNALPEAAVTVDGVLAASMVVWLSLALWRAFDDLTPSDGGPPQQLGRSAPSTGTLPNTR